MNAANVRIHCCGDDPGIASALAEILVDCVQGGASVSFMWPLAHHKALSFWQGVIDSAQRGERIVLVAEDQDSATFVGTVQVVFAVPDNQPHRALPCRSRGVEPRRPRRFKVVDIR